MKPQFGDLVQVTLFRASIFFLITIYAFSYSDDQNIFCRYIWSSPTVSGSQLPRLLEFLSAMGASFVIILVSCPQCLKSLQSHKGEKGVLLFIISSFPAQLGLCKWDDFGKHLQMEVGCRRNFSPTWWFPGTGDRLEVESVTIGQRFNQSSTPM